MENDKMEIEGLAEVPIGQLVRFLRFIAENDMWDELEHHLNVRGCDALLMSFGPIQAIGGIVETKARERTGQQSVASGKYSPTPDTFRCGCNGPLGPRPGPVTPGGGGDAGGGGDGGTRPRNAWLAVRVDSLVNQIERANTSQ